ncbi:MAG: DUF4386 domain-containing protein [Acidobacteriaceae bacterium]|nr:DUF4386 domain-containing protein [Acidobacteriaceae bacterium]
MTRKATARTAGFTLLFYICAGILQMTLGNAATAGAQGSAAKLARIAEHASDLRVGILLGLLECFSALVLGVTFYAITRDEGPELALFGLVCRLCEGVLGAVGIPQTLALLWLATAGAGGGAPEPGTVNALGAYLLMPGPAPIGAIFWAAGSTVFSFLLLRGKIVPVFIAWLGVLSSALLVVGLPMQLVGALQGGSATLMWLPVLVFELALGPWLIVKGVPEPASRAPLQPMQALRAN